MQEQQEQGKVREKVPRAQNFLRMNVAMWGLLEVAGILACVPTLLGFLGRFAWHLDLFSHFRVQYLLGLSLFGVLFLMARRWKAAAAFFAFAGINLAFLAPLYFGGRTIKTEEADPVRVMLINVNTSFGDPARVKQVVQEADPDILVLEEISSRWVRELEWLADSHPHSCVRSREDNFGIGLFSKLPIAESEVVEIGGAGVPSIVASVEAGPEILQVIATHPLPPGSAEYSWRRNEQLDALPDYVDSSFPAIVLGDLNTTPWNYHFKRLLKRSGLLDSSRGWGIQPTWPTHNPLFWIPIDHCLHSPDVFVVNREIGPEVGSDHYPLIVDLIISTTQDRDAAAMTPSP